jgi:hypothetical protein
MTKRAYDYMSEQWIDISDSGRKPDSVATAEQWRSYTRSQTTQHSAKENQTPRFSLVEWFIIGPMVVGLGFMAGVFWP